MSINVEDEYFLEISKEIIEKDKYQELKGFTHHRCTTRYEHCLHVAYRAYCNSLKKNNLDRKSIIRGALLHDFYFYETTPRVKNHLKDHPSIAYNNAIQYFDLNDLEKDIILSHMYPIIRVKPKTKEARLVSKSDKVTSICEKIKIKKKFKNKFKFVLKQYLF